jgi:hypothetical protein
LLISFTLEIITDKFISNTLCMRLLTLVTLAWVVFFFLSIIHSLISSLIIDKTLFIEFFWQFHFFLYQTFFFLWFYTTCSTIFALEAILKEFDLFLNLLSSCILNLRISSSTPVSLCLCLRQFLKSFKDNDNFSIIVATSKDSLRIIHSTWI